MAAIAMRPACEQGGGLTRPDLAWVGLEGIDVDHPIEDFRHPLAAGLGAAFGGRNRAGEAELLRVYVAQLHPLGRHTEANVLVPARNAERHKLVELGFGGIARGGV